MVEKYIQFNMLCCVTRTPAQNRGDWIFNDDELMTMMSTRGERKVLLLLLLLLSARTGHWAAFVPSLRTAAMDEGYTLILRLIKTHL